MNPTKSLEELKTILRRFADERDWNKFHSPKNLAMALIVEVAELAEHFQWLTEDESKKLSLDKKQKITEEAADILIYLTRFCDVMDIDLLDSAFQKVRKNESKYPKKLAKGTAKKYTELNGKK